MRVLVVEDEERLAELIARALAAEGHAPTAVHIPMSELPTRVDELVPFLDRDEPLVITCRSGGRVQRVMPWLAQQGYEVANMTGGMRAWHAAGKPMETSDGSAAQVP